MCCIYIGLISDHVTVMGWLFWKQLSQKPQSVKGEIELVLYKWDIPSVTGLCLDGKRVIFRV